MKESTNSISNPCIEDWIIGTWDWKEIRILALGVCPPDDLMTPQSAGYTEQRKFLPDGQVECYKNGKLVDTYAYRIESYRNWEPKGAPASTERFYRLYIGEKTNKAGTGEGVKEFPCCEQITISTEELKIWKGAGCGSQTVFVRVKET